MPSLPSSPRTIVQTCIVHLIRNSLSFVSWQDRKRLVPALRAIYRAETAEVAELRLADFEAEWGKKYPAIAPAWRRVWNEVVPFFAYPPQIRKMIYTTNAIESLHRGLRKIIKTRGAFPSDEAATKLLYLALRNLGVHWKPGEPPTRSSPSSLPSVCLLHSVDDNLPWNARTQLN